MHFYCCVGSCDSRCHSMQNDNGGSFTDWSEMMCRESNWLIFEIQNDESTDRQISYDTWTSYPINPKLHPLTPLCNCICFLHNPIPSSHSPSTILYLPTWAWASAALFCRIAWSSANRNPTRWVILINRSAQFSTQDVSYLSRDLERKEEMHVEKHRSVRVLYMLFVFCLVLWRW